MKRIIFALSLLISASVFASNLRDLCENAYYADAGGVTKLHQYRVIVKWGKLSDYQMIQFEDLIYAEKAPLKMVSEMNWKNSNGDLMSTYTLKESKGYNYRDYVIALEEIAEFNAATVSCK